MGKIKTTSVKEKDKEDEQIFLMTKLGRKDDDEDEWDDDEGEEQEASQAKLLSDMMKITKKKGEVQQAVRTTLSTSAMDTSHLLKSLGQNTTLRKDGQSHTLALAPEKIVAKRIKRAAGFENVAMEANKWATVVKARREADQLRFPLDDSNLQLKAVDKAEPIQMKQPLEREVYALLQGAKLVQEKKETEEEEAVRKALSLQEIRERNRELWRQKEMKRRYEQKARLMNKSKSRKHHRLLRREKLRKQRAELEELQKTDAEAALEQLRELEQARIEERMSLRHKTSKWAHLQGFRATRDKAAMAALQENQRMHRELTTKTSRAKDSDQEDSEEEEEAGEGDGEGVSTNPSNPWTKNLKGAAQVKGKAPEDESFTRFKKFWEEVNQRKEHDRKIEEEMEKEEEEEEEEEEQEEEEEEEDEEEDDEEEEEELQESTKSPTKKESESNKETTEKSPRESKKSKKDTETVEIFTDNPVSIDEMLDEAEIKIKSKVQKKLKKMGVKIDEPWKEVKAKKKARKNKPGTTQNAVISEIQEYDFTSLRNEENIDEREHRAKTLEDLEALREEGVDKLKEATRTLEKGSTTTTKPKESKPQVDPNKFLQVESKLLATAMPDSIGEAGEALDDEETPGESTEDIIREAFADDYLMEEFSSEKAEAIKKDQPNSMSLALPGWGDWTGPNIKMSNTKVKRFRLRVPHAPRKDSRIGHVLYNEKADVHSSLRKAMVSDLPYPFKSVKDFEASVRAPVGRLFVPEAAHKKLTAPGTLTKMGAVIQPMTEEELLRHETPVRKSKGERRYNKPGGGGSKRKAKSEGVQKGQKRKVLKIGERPS